VLLQHILSELFGRHIDTPLSKVWWKPIWRVIWQNMRQGSHVMWQFVKSLSGYYQDYHHDVQGNSATSRIPIVSGSPMGVRFKSISADCLALLNDIKQDISLNTLLQVMIGEHLKKFNIQQEPITYTIPVDLRRYLSESDVYYPSNLASQIRITLPDTSSPVERIQILQQQISEKLQKKEPLVGIPGEWLLAMGGKKTYQAVNRDWLLKSTHNDPRVFILSNLGKLDSFFTPFEDVLAEVFLPQLVIPLMGSPPLVFSFNTLCHQGNIALTYDPQLFSSEQIDSVLSVFDSSKIHNFAKSFTE
jgi:hypothetical protein